MKSLHFFTLLFSAISLLACNTSSSTKTESPDSSGATEGKLVDVDTTQMLDTSDFSGHIGTTQSTIALTPIHRIKVTIHTMEGYGQDEPFASEAASLLEKILNSKEFEQRVKATSFRYHNNEQTSTEIYNTIMKGHEQDGPGGTDSVVDLRLRVITEQQDGARWLRACNGSTIGIDGGGTGISAVCPNWLRSTALEKHHDWLAAHFIHEYMHILGYKHPTHKSKSVPYLIHGIIEDIAPSIQP